MRNVFHKRERERETEEAVMRCWIAVVFLYCSLLQPLGVRGAIVVRLSQSNYTVEESSGISVCLSVTDTSNSSFIDLLFLTVGGTATEGVDYTLIANHTLQLPPLGGSGPLPSEHCLPVFQLCEDSIPEDDENFTISLTSPNTPALMLQKNFTVHIIDDDRVEVSFTRERYTVSEAGAVEVCAETSGSSDRAFVPLTMITSPGTARNTDFYVSGVRLNRQINSDGSYFQKCMTLTAVDDDLPEQKEFFRITMSSTDSLVDIERNSVKIYITDNDPLRFLLAQSVYEVEEGETARVCLVATTNDLPLIRFHLIILDIGGNATGQDYTVYSEQDHVVGVSSYSESNEICFDVATTDDTVSEGTEREILQLLLSTNVAWVMLDMPHLTTVDIVILDNDVVRVEFNRNVYVKIEGTFPYLSLCIDVYGRVSQQSSPTLTISTSSGTAIGGSDYEASIHQFELPVSRYCHQVRIFDDGRPEPEEMFQVCLSTGSSMIHLPTHCVPVHIIDNDTPEVVWEKEQYSVAESEGSVQVCAQLMGTLNSEVEILLTATDITAIGSYDYGTDEKVFSFGPSSEERQCMHIDILSDHLVEETETFRVALSYTGSEAPLNISRPYIQVHIQNTSSGSSCVEGDILLSKGSEGNLSLVELCGRGGRWQSACDTDWTAEDTATVCQQAGFSRLVMSQVSLASLETAAGVFRCASTETRLAQCLGERPANVTCHHLLVACSRETLATSSSPSQSPGDVSSPTSPSRLGQPAPSSARFPIVGVVVGVFSALLLVGVVVVVGVVSGALLWRRKKSKCLAIASEEKTLENPVYEVLETRRGSGTQSPPTNTTTPASSSSSSHTSCDLYSEIPPLSASASPSRGPPPSSTLPSFYDVIRPHENLETDASSTDNLTGGEEREGEKLEIPKKAQSEVNDEENLYEETQPTTRESNLYESVSDPFSSLEGSGEYSILERRRGYATLEPYTGVGGTLRMKQLAREGEGKGGVEEEEYAHLNH